MISAAHLIPYRRFGSEEATLRPVDITIMSHIVTNYYPQVNSFLPMSGGKSSERDLSLTIFPPTSRRSCRELS
jgi:hypothetical protein